MTWLIVKREMEKVFTVSEEDILHEAGRQASGQRAGAGLAVNAFRACP